MTHPGLTQQVAQARAAEMQAAAERVRLERTSAARAVPQSALKPGGGGGGLPQPRRQRVVKRPRLKLPAPVAACMSRIVHARLRAQPQQVLGLDDGKHRR